VEAIGSFDPALDAEAISLADRLLKEYGINGYVIKLNSLGCANDKKELSAILHKELKDKIDGFCPDSQRRYKGNILRVLDCKNDACKEAVRKLDIKEAHLCPDCKEHFAKVRAGLDLLKIDYQYVPSLVRGLDYYTGTVFEIAHPELGAQDALGAGGRYNDLVHELGGPEMGAVGFAFGVERILLVTRHKAQGTSKNLTYLITLGEEAKNFGIGLLSRLRNQGIACDTDYEGKSLKGAMRKANDLAAKFVIIIGEDELKKNVVTLKNMVSGEQKEARLEELGKELEC
jgi:histidyl-tRNA synthetase